MRRSTRSLLALALSALILVACDAPKQTRSRPKPPGKGETTGKKTKEEKIPGATKRTIRGDTKGLVYDPTRPITPKELRELEMHAMGEGGRMLEQGATRDEVVEMLTRMGARVGLSSDPNSMIIFDFGHNSYGIGGPVRTGLPPRWTEAPMTIEEWGERQRKDAERMRAERARREDEDIAERDADAGFVPCAACLIPDD